MTEHVEPDVVPVPEPEPEQAEPDAARVVRVTRRVVHYNVEGQPRSGISHVDEHVLETPEEKLAREEKYEADFRAVNDPLWAEQDRMDVNFKRAAEQAEAREYWRKHDAAIYKIEGERTARIAAEAAAAQARDDAEEDAEDLAIEAWDGEPHDYAVAEFLDDDSRERCRVCGVASDDHKLVPDDAAAERFSPVKSDAGSLSPGQPRQFHRTDDVPDEEDDVRKSRVSFRNIVFD